ncbi:MAG: hypothetical protein EOM14_08450 [Clostridia bacterium]|nr:hypothetical protein [Clostridia bacterium]
MRRLQDDRDLAADDERKAQFLSYATLYDTDLMANLRLTSVELDNKYVTGDPASWLEFLRHPIVKRYVDSYLEETAEKKAALVLSEDAGKPRDALSIQKSIQDKRKGDDNSNIVVFFMPQKKYRKR